jgi:hypothetical protein
MAYVDIVRGTGREVDQVGPHWNRGAPATYMSWGARTAAIGSAFQFGVWRLLAA